MSAATGTFHLSYPRLDGPAERTVVEPWLTDLSHATLNAYAETAAAPALAPVETLPAARVPARPVRRRPARVAVAA
ncbi:hypothetical protein [Actinomadura decatromicini]|uniref:Uncharacterized protein n=1 Tax=Actinomadura decatromicini TaxID=2604572 RepID=A0A5D3FYW0_9ACTN|nr:hypothetical protein [Actinomadura decatromicini]TYK52365.1 hypothetical protein FXF68_00775 [Actinomadura decatromicini]